MIIAAQERRAIMVGGLDGRKMSFVIPHARSA
jgi:hypothetical protein